MNTPLHLLGYEPDNAYGGAGDDDFYSGGWGDFLVGGAGDDDFYFQNQIGFGATYVIGGSGADNYYFQSETFDPGEGGGSSFTDIIGIFNITGLTDWAADFIDIGLLRDAVSLAIFETGLDITLDYALFNIGGDSLYLDGSQQPLIGNQFFPVIDFTNSVYNIVINIDDIADAPEEPLPPPPVEETGGEGNDDIRGDGGDDILNGAAGDDTLLGKAGDDTLNGGAGDDRLRGGEGADALDGGDGIDILDYRDSSSGVTIDLAANLASGGDADGDTIINFEKVFGSKSGDDTLTGDGQDNVLKGFDGDDALDVGLGDDVLRGGEGADTLDGGEGVDTLDYRDSGSGVNVNLATGSAAGGDAEGDTITNFEKIFGSKSGNDVLTGDGQDNVIRGFGGDDVLNGGAGNDRLVGGEGSDIFLFDTANFGNDRIIDFEDGIDLIDLSQTGISFADLSIEQVNSHVDVSYDDPIYGEQSIRLNDFDVANLDQSDFLF